MRNAGSNAKRTERLRHRLPDHATLEETLEGSIKVAIEENIEDILEMVLEQTSGGSNRLFPGLALKATFPTSKRGYRVTESGKPTRKHDWEKKEHVQICTKEIMVEASAASIVICGGATLLEVLGSVCLSSQAAYNTFGWPPRVDPATMEQFANQPGCKFTSLPEAHCTKVFYEALYECCLSYLKETYPLESFTCDTVSEFAIRGATPSFLDILVNIVVDGTPLRPESNDREDVLPEKATVLGQLLGSPPSNDGILLAEFVASMYHEVLEKLLAPDSAGEDQLSRDHGKGESLCTHHYLCRIRDLLSPASEELHYKALLLDTLDLRWKVLCTFRRAEVWSPMPWSLRSREEPSAIPAKVLDSSTPPLPTLDEDDLCHSNDPEIMTTIQSVFGSPIDIPWLDAPHDGYPFHATLSEYTQTRLFRGMHSVRDDFALWVSALTFGLLEVITQTRIPEALLLPAGHGGERVISGTRVLQLLVGWLVKKSEARPGPDADPPLQGEWRDYGRLVSRILTRAIKVLNEFGPSASIKKFVSVDKQQQTEIRSGIALTVLTLCLMARYLWHDLPEVASLLEFGTDTNVILHGILIVSCNVKMRLGGWCPYLVSRATSSRLLQLPLPYLSQLHRLPPSRCSSFEDHRGCTESSCVFYTIDATTYIPKHADSDPSGSCYYIRPPVEEVTRLLSEGVIPVIFYDGSRLHVRKSTSGPYVAISHVWADGMGSTTQAGLPRCVVERISGLATSLLPKHGLFWIDSLCIPVQRELRKKAIKLMASTYREAAKVLVVDAGIRATCSESAPREENLLRITFSGWNKRVWTLQEGLLARELWFEFIEGPVNIDQGLPSFHLSLNTQLARALSLPNPRSAAKFARPEKILSNSGNTHATAVTDSPFVHGHIEALLRRDQVVPLLQYRQEHVQADSNHINAPLPLDELMGLLQGRRTTKPEDETLAVSSLLTPHIDLDALLSITGDDAQQRRLKALLIQMHELPMVFTEMRMTRLTLPKFSWAPQALVAADSRWHATKAVGTCTENGFLAEYYLALLHKPEDDSQNSMEFASRIPTSRLLVVKDGMCSDVDFDETPEMASQHRDSTDAFLIINPENDFGGGTGGVSRCIAVSGARVALGIDSVDAVLPPLHTTRDTPIRLDYISSVNLSHYTLFPAYEKRHRTVIGELTKAWILLQ